MITTSTSTRRGQETIRIEDALARRTAPAARMEAPQGEGISLGKRLRDWKTLAGFAASAAIVIFFVMSAHLDLGAVWDNVRQSDLRFLAVATLVYFGAFL